MAGEMIISSITDLFASEELAAEFLLTLAARDGSVLTHPALMSMTGPAGSDVVKVPHYGIGADLMTTINQDGVTEHANTAFTDSSTDVTIVPRAIRRNVSDFAGYVAQGRLGAQTWAQDLAISYAQSVINVIATLTSGFTAIQGATTVDLTWDTIIAAKGVLSVANADGPMMAILHPQQWADLEVDALTLGDLPARTNESIVNQGLSSYKGNYFGIDFFTSTHVPTITSGADRGGALITRGAIAWADALVGAEPDPNIAVLGRAILERNRRGLASATDYMLKATFGASIAINARGVTIRSDA